MNDKKLKTVMNYWERKKFPFTSREVKQKTVIDKEYGLYDTYSIRVKTILGIPFKKRSKKKFISGGMTSEEEERNNLIGFKRGDK